MADDAVFEEIASLVGDPEHGAAREMLVAALGNMKDPRALPLALTFLSDDDFAGYAARALGKLKDPTTRSYLEALLRNSDPWIRTEAKRAISKIDRATQRRVAQEAKRSVL